MEEIAMEMCEKYKDNLDERINDFLGEVLEAIMYLLKREQSLHEFCKVFIQNIKKKKGTQVISQRFLIDTLLTHSDRSLSRRILTLLSKRNPVPLMNPPRVNGERFHILPDLLHI